MIRMMIHKLVEILESAKDEEIDMIYKQLFDESVCMLNYIKAYALCKINDINGIIKAHRLLCMLQEVYDE